MTSHSVAVPVAARMALGLGAGLSEADWIDVRGAATAYARACAHETDMDDAPEAFEVTQRSPAEERQTATLAFNGAIQC